jgi:hypothetical protein
MRALEILELAQQSVVDRVGDLRLVQGVVKPVVAVQLEGEFFDAPPAGGVSLGSQALVSAECRMPSYQIPGGGTGAERVCLSALRPQ